MAYEHPGGASLDYRPCRYGASKLLFRGPKAKLAPPYTLFFGGTETYGRFVARPFTTLLQDTLGLNAVNMGCINGGLDAFAGDAALLEAAARAERVVIQILGAHNLSNPYYRVHPRRNDRFVAATDALVRLFPDVDMADVAFTRHLVTKLERRDPQRLATMVAALQKRWATQMEKLITAADGRVVLLWVSTEPPPQQARAVGGKPDPLFIDVATLAPLVARAERMVTVVPSTAAVQAGTRGMVFTEFESHIADATFGPAVHVEIAEAMTSALSGADADA